MTDLKNRGIDASPRVLGLLGLLGAACGPSAPQDPDGTGTGTDTDPTTSTEPTGSSDPTDPTSPSTTVDPPECNDNYDCEQDYCGYCSDGVCKEGVGCCGVAEVAVPRQDGKGWRCQPPYECYTDSECYQGYECDYGRCISITVMQLPPCRPLALDVSQWNLSAPSSGLVLADLDGDDDLDLASAAPTVAGIELFLNDGSGVFSAMESPQLGEPTGELALAAGDLDSDGDTDLVAARSGAPGELFLVFGQDAVFSPQQLLPTRDDARQVFITDLNGDGLVDVVVIGGGVTVHFGDGMGSFTPGNTPGGLLSTINGPAALVDVTLDGFPDLIAPLGDNSLVQVWAGDAQGFTDLIAVDPLGTGGAGVAGELDVVVAPDLVFTSSNDSAGLAQVLAADLPGQWASQVGRFGTSAPLLGGTLGAFGPEAGTDLVAATGQVSLAMLVGDGKSAFVCERMLPAPGPTTPALTAVGDIDDDGDLDIVVGNTNNLDIMVLRP